MSGSSTSALICIPVFSTLRWRKARIGAYLILGASALIPLLQGSQLYGREYMTQYSGMNWYLLELAVYGGGTALYAVSLQNKYSIQMDISCDLTSSYSSGFPNALLLANLIFGVVLIKSSTSPSCVPCIYTPLASCRLSRRVIHWIYAIFRPLIGQLRDRKRIGALGHKLYGRLDTPAG